MRRGDATLALNEIQLRDKLFDFAVVEIEESSCQLVLPVQPKNKPVGIPSFYGELIALK